ncbi:MAG: outer membrane protein transport protein [Rhodobiaceae bacterium]|nr:outer membrane protein transport protein [Rhodobiaceae bacterium]
MKNRVFAQISLAAIVVSLSGVPAFAGGFYAPYQSSSANATALAGASAGTGDPSGLFFNPAANASLQGHQVYVDAKVFVPNVSLNATTATGPNIIGNPPLAVPNTAGGLADTAFAPNVYASYSINDRLKLGFAFSGPFAAKIDADPTWSGRYQLTKTDMTTYAGTVSLAYQVNQVLAIGGGVTVEYLDGTFERVEFVGADGIGYLEGDDVAVGFNAGLIWTPHEGTTIGLAYRSQMDHGFSGMAGIRGNFLFERTADYDMTLPQVVSLGIRQDLHENWTLLGEVQWQDSSSFTGFDIALGPSIADPTTRRDVRPQEWDDSFIIALGLQYRSDEKTTWSTGIHYDTAVSDGGGNTLSPDGDRIMIGFGVEKQVSERFKWSAHYAHVFYKNAGINVTPSATNTQGALIGSLESDLHMFGIAGTLTW